MIKRTIGIRDAKAQLSKVLNDVKQGAEWIITDRGKPIAKLIPVAEENLTLEDRIHRLEKRGLIKANKKSRGTLPPPLPLKGARAQLLLQEDRDNRNNW